MLRKKYYEQNKAEVLKSQRGYQRKNRKRITQCRANRCEERGDALRYMAGDICPICGNPMPIPNFHHPDDNKICEIGAMLDGRIERLVGELDKCEVMCRSCHAKLHKNRGVI